MSPKELQKLAKACRKAGIKSFKCADFEFTLADTGFVESYAPKTKGKQSSQGDVLAPDSLTEDQLLYWSVGQTEETTQ